MWPGNPSLSFPFSFYFLEGEGGFIAKSITSSNKSGWMELNVWNFCWYLTNADCLIPNNQGLLFFFHPAK